VRPAFIRFRAYAYCCAARSGTGAALAADGLDPGAPGDAGADAAVAPLAAVPAAPGALVAVGAEAAAPDGPVGAGRGGALWQPAISASAAALTN